jgi:asparagine synthase (glutamine-hydrolysing)
VGKRLPPVLLKIPKKGFVAPLREWFKEKLFEDKLNNLYLLCRYGLDRNILRQIINANKNGERDYGNFIWMLAVLDSWISNYNTK